MIVFDCGTTLGTVRSVVVKLCTTLLAVAHDTALGEDIGRSGGRKSYSGIPKITQIGILPLTGRHASALVRVVVSVLTSSRHEQLALSDDRQNHPCVLSAPLCYCLDCKHLRYNRFELFNNEWEDGCFRKRFLLTRCSPVIAVHHIDVIVWNEPRLRSTKRLVTVSNRSNEVERVTTKCWRVSSTTSTGMHLARWSSNKRESDFVLGRVDIDASTSRAVPSKPRIAVQPTRDEVTFHLRNTLRVLSLGTFRCGG